jgi:hypothetical protein
MKKNTLAVLMSDPHHYNPALTPCLKSECDRWENGMCSQIRKAGKPDHTQVF